MQLSHACSSMSAAFDEPNLVVSAGLVPALALAESVGIGELARERLTVPGSAGANAGKKVMSLVAGMAAGADSIDDMGMLRHGAADVLFGGMRAPSTLGTFLRAFTFGHVRQLDAVASRALVGLAGRTDLLPGIADGCLIDIDDTIDRVYGTSKQGAEFGYTKVRGINAQLAAISTAKAAPVIAATRLRRGAVSSGHGAPQMIAEAVATARRCGATGPILVRADSAYCHSKTVAAIRRAGATFSIAIKQDSRVKNAIAAIPEDAWVRIEYPWAIPDPETGELVSAAEIAETPYTAFASKPKKEHVEARLIVRRIPERNEKKLAGQEELFPLHRYHALITDSAAPLVEAESTHRGHAVIESVFADLKASALAHLPSGVFAANAAWLVCAAIAFNLTRALGRLAGGALSKAETATIRARIINIPARVARSARRITLHLPERWLWATSWLTAWRHALAPAR